ncbi:unnamed protein product [Ceutorhynchus assimilis]|uniref:Uncharacterized protein n=1 Tax=Ceutorhynchus assimilis TaxID=467358 RepID=A0A9N9QF62_9CUCU|nr:unnamed protein product [Ceutorhynchus assimilis]
MVQLNGTYEFVSQDNYLEYVKSLGLPDDKAQKVAGSTGPLVIALTGNNLTVTTAGNAMELTLNQECDHTLPTGHQVKTTTTVNGNTITFKSNMGPVTEDRVFEVTDSGLTSMMTNSNGVKAVRKYKRV